MGGGGISVDLSQKGGGSQPVTKKVGDHWSRPYA